MGQAPAKAHTADRPAQQMLASPPAATNPAGFVARHDSLSDSNRVEAESKGQRRKRHREEAQQAAAAAQSPRPQQTPGEQSKRAKNHQEQATTHQGLAAPEVVRHSRKLFLTELSQYFTVPYSASMTARHLLLITPVPGVSAQFCVLFTSFTVPKVYLTTKAPARSPV